MKTRKIILLSAIFLFVLLMSGCNKPASKETQPSAPSSQADSGKVIELKLNLGIPETHLRYRDIITPWIKEIEEKSGGRVKIKPYFAASLSSQEEAYDSTIKGLADISDGIQHVTPGRFPLSEVMLLGQAGEENKWSSLVFWDLYEKIPEIQNEYKDVKVLTLYVSAAEKLMTNKPVHTLEDIKGQKIHISGRTKILMAKALGLSPVSIPYGDVYLAGQKGVIDGGVWPYELLQSRKFAEVVKYANNASLAFTEFFLVMNKEKWNSLPDDIKQIIDDASGKKLAKVADEGFRKFSQEALDWAIKEHNLEIVKLTPEEEARWAKALDTSSQQWIDEVTPKGLPGKEVYEAKMSLWNEYLKK